MCPGTSSGRSSVKSMCLLRKRNLFRHSIAIIRSLHLHSKQTSLGWKCFLPLHTSSQSLNGCTSKHLLLMQMRFPCLFSDSPRIVLWHTGIPSPCTTSQEAKRLFIAWILFSAFYGTYSQLRSNTTRPCNWNLETICSNSVETQN